MDNKVKKYTITIVCEDELKQMKVGSLYLTKKVANGIYMFLNNLHEDQTKHTLTDKKVEAKCCYYNPDCPICPREKQQE